MKTLNDINKCVHTRYVIIDVSRLVSRAKFSTPTGIDRIDLHFILQLFANANRKVIPVCRNGKRITILRCETVLPFLRQLHDIWLGKAGDITPHLRKVQRALLAGRVFPVDWSISRIRELSGEERITYACFSHTGVPMVQGLLERMKEALGMETLIYIHDIIPLEYPEYTTESSSRSFRSFLDTIVGLRSRFVVNSTCTAKELTTLLEKEYALRPEPPRVVIPDLDWLQPDAVERHGGRASNGMQEPYFVVISTLEPRKNHLLLLQLWRKWAREGRRDIPHLYLVGRRGWENEQTFRFLDRCEAIRPWVHELGCVPQLRLLAILKGARALLMPSFAEGLGLPVLEALSLNVPIVASDIDIFREMKNILPESTTMILLDPLDARGWEKAIKSFHKS